MSRTGSGLLQLFLMVLMLVGMWLASSSDTTLLIGLLLGFGAAAGLVVLARRENSRPLAQEERAAWAIIRAKGKRRFVLRAVMNGLLLGVAFLVYELIRALWTGEPFTATYTFLLITLALVLYIGGSYLTAIKKWSLYEERYKESLR
jgi:drug/metabolite transporter (DMT)-like permease